MAFIPRDTHHLATAIGVMGIAHPHSALMLAARAISVQFFKSVAMVR
jgi:hypothetical protein